MASRRARPSWSGCPSRGNEPLTLAVDPQRGINRDAPLLVARSESGDRTADALFAYMRSGRLDSARQASPGLIAQAEGTLQQKVANPVYATLAAYTLLKLGSTEHPDWIANLAHWFKYLPDGAILYGWYLIRAGRAEEALAYFETALKRGVPMYSEGIRLLRDGLNFLRGLDSTDPQVNAAVARVYRIATAANLNSELTCLRVGSGLAVRLLTVPAG